MSAKDEMPVHFGHWLEAFRANAGGMAPDEAEFEDHAMAEGMVPATKEDYQRVLSRAWAKLHQVIHTGDRLRQQGGG